jgi:hypothetical protein
MVEKITSSHLAGCQCGQCGSNSDTLVLHPRCHTGQGTYAWYNKKDHTMTIKCAVCEKHVGTFYVSETPYG